jgi:hypothetical protein
MRRLVHAWENSMTLTLTAAQYEAVRLAAARPSRALEPMPSSIRGAAKLSVLAALIARGYAVKCYLPGHIEYVLTDAGLTQVPRQAMPPS